MTTKLITAGVILVFAIVFGFIFWNQFTANQQHLAGTDSSQSAVNSSSNSATNSTASQSSQVQIPANDNLTTISTDLNASDINSIDSDSSQMNTQIQGF